MSEGEAEREDEVGRPSTSPSPPFKEEKEEGEASFILVSFFSFRRTVTFRGLGLLFMYSIISFQLSPSSTLCRKFHFNFSSSFAFWIEMIISPALTPLRSA